MIVELSVPFARVGALIGKRGSVKRKIEETANVQLQIDGNSVFISGDAEHVYFAESVVKAVARGFNPEIALNLLDPDYSLEVIELPAERNHRVRIRARLIGTDGNIRKKIEEETETSISIYGKTVSIIGRMENVDTAKRAVKMIIRGSKHSNVLAFLKRSKERWLI